MTTFSYVITLEARQMAPARRKRALAEVERLARSVGDVSVESVGATTVRVACGDGSVRSLADAVAPLAVVGPRVQFETY